MRDTTLPIAIRIKATEGAAPYFTPRPRPGASLHYPCVSHHLEYVIGDNQALREALARGTEDQNSFTQDPDGDNANSQSFSSSASNNPQPRDDEPGDPNFMTTNSSPLTFDEIQEVRPQSNASTPTPTSPNSRTISPFANVGTGYHSRASAPAFIESTA